MNVNFKLTRATRYMKDVDGRGGFYSCLLEASGGTTLLCAELCVPQAASPSEQSALSPDGPRCSHTLWILYHSDSSGHGDARITVMYTRLAPAHSRPGSCTLMPRLLHTHAQAALWVSDTMPSPWARDQGLGGDISVTRLPEKEERLGIS